jgi:hypothetical protein
VTRPAPDELAEHTLGTLPESRSRELEAEAARSPELRREISAVRELLALLPEALAPVTPSASGRASLLRALDSGERFRPFVEDLARHFDLAKARVRELLSFVDDASRWEPGPLPGITLFHFAAGPNAIAPDTGFVRFPKGLHFPRHRHLGHEVNYVLEGAVRDGDGTLYLPGQAIVMAPHTSHHFTIPEDTDALVAVVQAGFELI